MRIFYKSPERSLFYYKICISRMVSLNLSLSLSIYIYINQEQKLKHGNAGREDYYIVKDIGSGHVLLMMLKPMMAISYSN